MEVTDQQVQAVVEPQHNPPTLETGTKVVKVQQLSYTFYSKPLASKYVILEPSAASYQSKKASLAQECVRRLLNTSEDRDSEERDQIVNKFQEKLRISGYSYDQQKEIIEAGIVGYKRRIENRGGEA